jgi:AraC-like DNA-binding protein
MSWVKQVMTVGGFSYDPTWTGRRHFHQHHELVYFTSGTYEVLFGDKKVRCEPGDAVIYKSNELHEENLLENGPAGMLFIEWDGKAPLVELPIRDYGGRLRTMLSWILDSDGQEIETEKSFRKSLAETILHEVLHLDQKRMSDSDMVENTRRYFQNHIKEPLSLEQIASLHEMSPYHFLRLYKQKAGVTPVSDFRKLRLERARYLLISTNWPLRMVAEETGFGSEFHLAKAFKQQFFYPPGQLRQSVKNKNPQP